jgi:hypothetical protein
MLYPQRYSELNPTPPAGMPGGLKPSVSVRQSLKPRPRIRIPMVRGRRDESGVLGARGARAPRGDDHAQRGARGRAWIERGGRRTWPSPASIRAALETLSLKRRSPRQSRGLRRLSDPKGIRTFRQRLRAGGMSAIPGGGCERRGRSCSPGRSAARRPRPTEEGADAVDRMGRVAQLAASRRVAAPCGTPSLQAQRPRTEPRPLCLE